jgi:hypothetical protein
MIRTQNTPQATPVIAANRSNAVQTNAPRTQAAQVPAYRPQAQQNLISADDLQGIALSIDKAKPETLQKNAFRLRNLIPRAFLGRTKPKTNAPQIAQVQMEQAPTVDPRTHEKRLTDTHKEALTKMSFYYCTDAVTFGGLVKKNNAWTFNQITEKRPQAFQADAGRQKAEGKASKFIASSTAKGQLTQKDLAIGAGLVSEAQAGCCSTLAVKAAHILTGGQRDTTQQHPKVEIVARHEGADSTHCYVIVGREEGSELSDPSSWGENALVVDPWLGSLGHDNVFTVKGFPKDAMHLLKANTVLYNSHQPDPVDEPDANKEKFNLNPVSHSHKNYQDAPKTTNTNTPEEQKMLDMTEKAIGAKKRATDLIAKQGFNLKKVLPLD